MTSRRLRFSGAMIVGSLLGLGPVAAAQSPNPCPLVYTTDGVSHRLLDTPPADASARRVVPGPGESVVARFDDGTCAEVRLLEGGRRLTAAVPDTARVGDAVALMLLVSQDMGPLSSEAVTWQTGAGKLVSGRIVEQVFPKAGAYQIRLRVSLPDGRDVLNTYDIEIIER